MLRFPVPTEDEKKDIEVRLRKFSGQPKRDFRRNLGIVLVAIACGHIWSDMSGELDKIKSNKTEFKKWRKKLEHSVKATHRSDLPMLTLEETNAISKNAPPPRGNPRGDDQLILSGIFFQVQTGCRICDIPRVRTQ